ncbi:MAG: class I SAM-dependent methyltransferase [Candidatus Hydrogenedentes bacterium]|nr:class I SAM-dependent methyltransferase [Candidatus Hydrogenedentota bacterium]
MIKETYHFLRRAPGVMKRQKALGPVEFFKDFTKRVDADGFGELRASLVDGLEGHILEIGAGTGATFPYYENAARVTAIEPSRAFQEAALETAKNANANIQVVPATGEHLPFANATFDAVSVCTVLCSVASPSKTLAEFKRVLRPGGKVHLVEHVRSEDWLAGPLLDLLNPFWLRINKMGCNWNRKTVEEVRAAGLTIRSIESSKIYSNASPVAFPLRVIKAEYTL